MESRSTPCINLGSRHFLAKKVFSPKEDARLLRLVQSLKRKKINWKSIANKMANRTPRQCRDRYMNYLSPELNKAEFTALEDQQIIEFYTKYGNKWSTLSKEMKGRSPNAIRLRCITLINNKHTTPCDDNKSATGPEKEVETTPFDEFVDEMCNESYDVFDPHHPFIDPFSL